MGVTAPALRGGAQRHDRDHKIEPASRLFATRDRCAFPTKAQHDSRAWILRIEDPAVDQRLEQRIGHQGAERWHRRDAGLTGGTALDVAAGEEATVESAI